MIRRDSQSTLRRSQGPKPSNCSEDFVLSRSSITGHRSGCAANAGPLRSWERSTVPAASPPPALWPTMIVRDGVGGIPFRRRGWHPLEQTCEVGFVEFTRHLATMSSELRQRRGERPRGDASGVEEPQKRCQRTHRLSITRYLSGQRTLQYMR